MNVVPKWDWGTVSFWATIAHVALFEAKLAIGTAAMAGSARLLYNRRASSRIA